jgi:hypothetical protein
LRVGEIPNEFASIFDLHGIKRPARQMIKFSNLTRTWLGCVILCTFVSQGAPIASAQEWSFFLECGAYPDKVQANQKVHALEFLGLPISVRSERGENGKIWYELVVKGMRAPDEARRTRILIEKSGGPRCKSELDH